VGLIPETHQGIPDGFIFNGGNLGMKGIAGGGVGLRKGHLRLVRLFGLAVVGQGEADIGKAGETKGFIQGLRS